MIDISQINAKRVTLSDIKKDLDNEISRINNACQPIEILVFGSFANNTATEASDIDIAIIVPDNTDLRAIKQKFYSKARTSHWPFDILFIKQSDYNIKKVTGGVCFEINENHIKLWSKDESTT